MKPYVMFGQSPYFGDYVDAIHALGGWLSRVVINVPERLIKNTKPFAERVEAYQAWLDERCPGRRVEVIDLADFQPAEDEAYLVGFRSAKMEPLIEMLRARFSLRFDSIIHPTAYVSPFATLGEGVFVGAMAAVASWARIEDFVILNRAATVGHDSTIGIYCNVGPKAAIASAVLVERAAIVALGANVLEGLRLEEGCFVGAGALVTKDVPRWKYVVGSPAKVIKDRPEIP